MVKGHSDSRRGNPFVSLHGLLFLTGSKDSNQSAVVSFGSKVNKMKIGQRSGYSLKKGRKEGNVLFNDSSTHFVYGYMAWDV